MAPPPTTPSTRRQTLLSLISTAASATAAAHTFLTSNDLTLHPSQTLALESNISQVSLSISNFLSLIHHPIAFAIPRPPPPPPSWFSRFMKNGQVDENDNDPFFSEAFRMKRSAFSYLVSLLNNSCLQSLSVPPTTAVAAAVFRLAHGAPFNAVGRRFDLDTPTAFDSECRFLDVSAGWPSTMKPELVLRQSELFSSVEETRELLNGATYQLNDGTDIPQYILGESCFPLLPWLITPYKKSRLDSDDGGGGEGDDLEMKEAFNSVHSRGMELVDTAFGRLRARWKILLKEWKEESIESFPYVVVACCLLHNFLIKSNEEFPDEDSDYMRNHDLSEYEGEGDETGERIRSAIAADLCRWEDC
ncbi:Harbinger transposase-derived nuclease [Artemisia annua]|uniref:Harbinger transposase-derived nuclease n=1 Tax=Artemisia annua TaxID=35608 RepID=A0A2U1Q2J9_ARTAN|nr:Harbinger transposase-derived nuclease [Artemisia annua]